MPDSADRDWQAAAVLRDPRRRAMYELIREAQTPLTRDDVARAAGLPRTGVGFHLDALVEAGLLSVDYARPPGRGGPGAGRPSKRYSATDAVVHAAVPGRRYEVVGRILAQAVLRTESDDAQRQVMETARAHGVEAGTRSRPDEDPADLPALLELLRSLGYRPAESPSTGTVRMRDCPFHDVSRDAPELVCPANLLYVQGLLDGFGAGAEVRAVLDEVGTGCCVSLKTDG